MSKSPGLERAAGSVGTSRRRFVMAAASTAAAPVVVRTLIAEASAARRLNVDARDPAHVTLRINGHEYRLALDVRTTLLDALRERAGLTGGSHGKKLMYASGAEFVEVRVHAATGEIRVPRIVGAFAAGRLANTRTARSQYMGGMIWGVSSALHEATEIDFGRARYVNTNLADYLVPVNADIDQLEVILIPEVDPYVNAAGVKGIGELANVGTAAAVANAVFHATGKRIRDLPIRIEKLI